MLKRLLFLIPIIILFISGVSLASSSDAWDEFRADVKEKCAEGVKEYLVNPEITVSDFGTESYGIAVAEGRQRDSNKAGAWICIYNKRTKQAEFIDMGLIGPRTYQKISAENHQLKSQTATLKVTVILLAIIALVLIILWLRSSKKEPPC